MGAPKRKISIWIAGRVVANYRKSWRVQPLGEVEAGFVPRFAAANVRRSALVPTVHLFHITAEFSDLHKFMPLQREAVQRHLYGSDAGGHLKTRKSDENRLIRSPAT